MERVKKIAITMGDPGGIGPEVIVKALFQDEVRDICLPFVIGDADVMREAAALSGIPLQVNSIDRISRSRPERDTIDVLHVETCGPFKKGLSSEKAGTAVVAYVKNAAELAMKGDVQAVVTAPISKESLNMAGHPWPGHTELLAELSGAADVAMMFVSDILKVILCTIHIPLGAVSGRINKALVYRRIMQAEQGADMLGIESPRIAVAGLNPHSGESGIMGREDQEEIIPAVREAQAKGIDISGPLPPDVVFHKAYNREFDIVVCMYHDQGLIPFKMMAFEKGVNVTLGLPFIRTSPDHGTAFDIAWENKANPSSMIEAVKLAASLNMVIGNR